MHNRPITNLIHLSALLVLVILPANAQGQSVDPLIENANQAIDDMNEEQALEYFLQAYERDDEHFEVLWNTSFLYSRVGNRLEHEDQKREYYNRGLDIAERCKQLYPESAECHYVYAVATGRLANVSGSRERVELSEPLKEHTEKALELDPEHAGAWHLLGRWHYEITNLSWVERQAANLLFGGVPEGASLEEAIASLERALEIDPDNILFHLDLAKALKDRGDTQQAVQVLQEGAALEPRREDDPQYLQEIDELLVDLQE